MSTLRFGMVGCGGISYAHGNAAKSLAHRVKFDACCDVVPTATQAWVDEYGQMTQYLDYNEMFAKETDLDAVVLATWPNQHLEQIQACLAAGQKRILCEKSLEVTGERAYEIFTLAQQHDATIMEAFMYRHHPAMLRMRQLVDMGEIGKIDSVRACFSDFDDETSDPNDPNRNWRQRKECGGGIPYDFACYCVNAIRFFADSVPARVRCYGGKGLYDTVNRMYAVIEFENGVVGLLESSKKESFTQEVQVNGHTGILDLPISWTIPHSKCTITKTYTQNWADHMFDRHMIKAADPYACQMENFLDVLEGKAPQRLPLAESVVNVFTIEALVNSIEENREITLDIPADVKAALAK
jgi:predicted dehydrogenase